MATVELEQHVPAGQQIAQCLLDGGCLTPDQLTYASRIHQKVGQKSLITVLRDLRYVDDTQVRAALRSGRIKAPLGLILVELGVLSEADLSMALAIQAQHPGLGLAEILAEHNFVSASDAFGILADLLGIPMLHPERSPLDRQQLARVPLKSCELHGFIPLGHDGPRAIVAFANPQHGPALELARRSFGRDLVVGLAPRRAILDALERGRHEVSAAAGAPATGAVDAVNQIINAALAEHASDIHFEPMRGRMRVRFRQDGTLLHHRDLATDEATAVVNRLKVLAGADIAERRRHQDGRIQFQSPRGPIDIRMSVYVTVHGETVVLRLLNNRETLLSIREIGMSPRMLRYLQEDVLDTPSGVVIVTGPTGSGKTTTLYAAVNHLNDACTSIITAEDPVEFFIDGISQCSINAKINLSYEESLRHIVRQDPDVIVIGEIRDQFSAEVAINAALTGHKVVTTFHTEDSIGGLVRLMNMNIESFLISSTVVSVVAQRLLRRVCPQCGVDHVLTGHELRRLGYVPSQAEGLTFRRGAGCAHCRHTGYKGRIAVFELLVLNEPVRDAVLARKTAHDIRRISLETSGLVTLLEDGIAKAAQGLTSFDEILRQLPRLSAPRPPAELARLLGDKS